MTRFYDDNDINEFIEYLGNRHGVDFISVVEYENGHEIYDYYKPVAGVEKSTITFSIDDNLCSQSLSDYFWLKYDECYGDVKDITLLLRIEGTNLWFELRFKKGVDVFGAIELYEGDYDNFILDVNFGFILSTELIEYNSRVKNERDAIELFFVRVSSDKLVTSEELVKLVSFLKRNSSVEFYDEVKVRYEYIYENKYSARFSTRRALKVFYPGINEIDFRNTLNDEYKFIFDKVLYSY
ncbi:hypothetical protein L4C36_23560, partial [Photobacterium japonica]|uniref:hypothetical protein n=1 Tax=Photobacterium japonica TaxID=2910235 RepID=UPI003D0F7957